MTHRVVIVGGGISGLAAAHRLAELSRESGVQLDLSLLETRPRLGGCIATERVDDFVVESGPDSFITEKPWALRLCERLGIASRLIPTSTAQGTVSVVYKGSLRPLPEGFLLLAPTRLWPLIRTPLFSWRGKLRMAAEIFLPRGNVNGDESLASFVRRRFGAEVLERVAQPLVGGIYAADPESLSLAATMPRFLEMERSKRSIVLAMRSEMRRRSRDRGGSGARWSLFVSLAGGMGELVQALSARLPEGSAHVGTQVTGLRWDAERKNWIVSAGGGEKFAADGVVLAAPSYSAGALLAPVDGELSRELAAISYSSTATVSLAYRAVDIPNQLYGFGFVVPAIEKRRLIACTFSSLKYSGRAPQGSVLLRAFVGGTMQLDLFAQDDRQMEASVRAELAALLGVKGTPLFSRIYRHPRAMPQYHVGHQDRVRRIEARVTRLPGLALAGNAYHGMGISDCVRSGEKAGETMWDLLHRG